MPVLEDIAKGEQFTDIPIQPAAIKPLTEEELKASRDAMRKSFEAKGLPVPPLAPGEKPPVKDLFAAEKQVPHDKFSTEQEVPDPFKGQRQADVLDERTPEDLARDPNFKIHDFIFANKDNIFSDPKRYQKALDTYREAQAEGVTLKKTVASVKKDTLPLLKDIIKSIPKRLENISDIAVAPLVDAVTMKMRGEALDPEKRDQWENLTEDAKEAAIAEAIAGTQTAVGSLQDMVRQGTRKLVGPAFEFGGKKDWRKISDDELKNELFKDLGWRETVEGLSTGRGVQDLVDQGVQLNPENIKLLSLTDPLTLVATGAGLKGVALGGRVIFTAANEAGAQAALRYLGRAAGQAASKGAEIVGRGAEVTGKVVGKSVHVPYLTAAGLGSGHFFKSLALAGAGKAAAKIIEKGGKLLREIGEAGAAAGPSEGKQLLLGLEQTTGSKVLNAAKAAGGFVKPPVVGALKGAAATAPLAFATDEPQGGLLGVGAVGGAVHGSVNAAKSAIAEAGAKRYFDPGQITWEKTESPGYDNFSSMNAVHEQVAANAPENARNMVNSLRETLRPFGRKLFLVDDATYQKAIENDTVRANGGQPLTPEQAAAVAEEAKTRGISKIFMADDSGSGEMVTLVKSAEDAPHEASHILESVMAPEARKALHDAVREAYMGDEIQQLKDHYESQLNRKMTPDEVESEFIADNWANLLYNTSLESLGLPAPRRGFKQVMLDAALALGNALGVDMTAGRKTPGLDIKPSYSLRKRLVEASVGILNERDNLAAQQATAPEVKPAAPEAKVVESIEVKGPAEAPSETKVQVPVEGAQAEFNFESPAKQEAAPAAPPPAPAPAEGQPAIRPDKSARRAEVTNTGVAMKWAEDKPNRDVVDTVNQALDEKIGLRVEHSGAPAEVFKPTEPEREAEIEAGRGLPPELREQHSKEMRPTRWETMKSGEPQLIARSTDKVLANVDRAVQWAKKTGEKVPWETDETGALTQAGADQLLADLNTYWDNQDRGFRGGGEKLVRPPEELGASIPAEQGEGVPLGAEKEQWLNLLQGRETGPPVTARAGKGLPANIKAQEIRAAQGLESERIAGGGDIPVYPAKVTGGRGAVEVRETNPLRNRFRAANMPVGDLHTVVERLNATDLLQAERRPELMGRGGSTDITRAGFLTEQPVSKTVEDVFADSPDQWTKRFGPNNTLTKTAYELGLGLKNREELAALQDAQAKAASQSTAVLAEVKAGNFDKMDEAYALATKAQFFREAVEAATDSGSAAGPSGWRRAFPDSKPPFATPESRQGFLSQDKMKDALEAIKNGEKSGETFDGDGSISDIAGKPLHIVTLDSQNIPRDQLTPRKVEAMTRQYKGILNTVPEAKIGVFNLETKGPNGEPMVSIDLNVAVDKKFAKNTLKFAKQNNQEAIFDAETGEVVPTGGNGETPSLSLGNISNAAKKLIAGKMPEKPAFVTSREEVAKTRTFLEKQADYEISQRETEAAAQKRVAETDYSKYNVAPEQKPQGKKPTGWVLPNGEFVGLDTDYHQSWLGENSDQLNTQFKTNFGKEGTIEDRLAALNAGFVRAREYGGKLVIEANQDFYKGAQKRAIEELLDTHAEDVDRVSVTLLNKDGQVTDSVSAKLFDADNPREEAARMLDQLNPRKTASKKGPSPIEVARSFGEGREGYLPKKAKPEKLTPATAEAAAQSHNEEMAKVYPEAYPTRFVRDSKGKLKLAGGKIVPADEEAVLDQTPLARDAVRNNPDAPKQDAIAEALADKIVDEAKTALKNPEMNKGLTWYDDAVKLIKKYFGSDPGLFAQLLAATSPQNGVQVNFYYALDAWNAARRGEYDGLVKKYKEGREEWKTGGPEVEEWAKETGGKHKPDATVVGIQNRNNFLTWFVDKHDLLPKRASLATGEPASYGMHSFAVLDVLAGTWLEDVGGPKVRNFLANLTGEGHDATIDIWATRFLMRLGQSPESLRGQWRVAPPAGWGISAENFTTAQKAFKIAADKMGVKPDSLQALVWFSEKHLWEEKGWTGFVGAAKSDYAYWLQSLEPGDKPETFNIPEAAKKEAARQGREARQRTEQQKSGQSQLDIPLVPSED
jgi:hypothetical protein